MCDDNIFLNKFELNIPIVVEFRETESTISVIE